MCVKTPFGAVSYIDFGMHLVCVISMFELVWRRPIGRLRISSCSFRSVGTTMLAGLGKPVLPPVEVGDSAEPAPPSPLRKPAMVQSKSAPVIPGRKKLGAIPRGRSSEYDDAPVGKVATLSKEIACDPAAVGSVIAQRMIEAVRLQAGAICEILPHRKGPVEEAGSMRVQGGWEVVRVCVCFASEDCARERDALDAFVWPELRARCAARRLHLLVIEPREGWARVPPATCLQ